MATKITDLTELAVTAASGDFLHIIDVDDTTGGAAGTSKKIQVTNLPSGGGSGTVTSVAMTVPAALSVSGSPITTSGTLAITGAGTSSQYIDGTGALQTTPTDDVSVTNQADNRIITATAVTDTLNGEANLTFDGTTLLVDGGVKANSILTGWSGLTTAGEYGKGAELLLGFTGVSVAGDCMYLRTTAGFSLASATTLNAASTAMLAIGISSDAADGVITRGVVYLDVDPGGSPGEVVYLSTTSGHLTTTAVSTSGNVSRVVGYQLATNIIFFNPSQDWIELA
jgi:hypothetical protein